MKKKGSGRIMQSFPVSLHPDDARFVEKRVKDLKPKVSSKSNYVQQLIELDRRFHILENQIPFAKHKAA